MTNKKAIKRAILSSALALILCVTSLVGTTFAWFTDSVTSGRNIIRSGNLDMKVSYKLYGAENTTWSEVTEDTNIFDDEALYEPGYTQAIWLKVENTGSLAFRYNLSIDVFEEIPGKNQAGNAFNLSDYLVVKATSIVDIAGWESFYETRESLNSFDFPEYQLNQLNMQLANNGVVLPKDATASEYPAAYVLVVLEMPTTVGNEANHDGKNIPQVKLGLNALATQVMYEEDSFGNDYDEDSTYPELSLAGQVINDAATTLPDGTDITTKVTKIVYGKKSSYQDIVNGGYDMIIINNNGQEAEVYYVPDDVAAPSAYEVYFLTEEKFVAPANSKSLFNGMSGITEFDTSNLDMSQVENALGMFANCSNLETLNTTNWDTSNITNMQSIFYGCNKLKNIDVSGWDTSNVTNMRMVFFRCYELSNDVLKGVESWDVSNVSNFYSMFKHARGLTSLDLSKWNTSSATNMSHMFANIGGVEQLDLSGFDTSKVTDMSWMFYDASMLTTIYVGDGWTTSALNPANPTCFYNNQALVGGASTAWLDVCDMANPNRPWESSAKINYAIVDGGTENRGLLTYKAN